MFKFLKKFSWWQTLKEQHFMPWNKMPCFGSTSALSQTHRSIFQSLGVHIKMYNLTTTTSFKNRLFKSSFRFMKKIEQKLTISCIHLWPHT